MANKKSGVRRLRRLAVAAVSLWAVTADFHGDPTIYFTYFTILTNMAIGTWFLAAALWPRPLEAASGVRLALTLYGLVTLSVYWVFLSPTYHPEGIAVATNLLLHLVLPLLMALEDLVVPWPRLGRTAPLWVLAWPLTYCAGALVRGQFTGWYPYFFLDPSQVGGWTHLTAFILTLLVAFTALAYGWRALVHRRHPKG